MRQPLPSRPFHAFFAALLTLCLCASAWAQKADNGTADEAVAMVQQVIASFKANGREKTLAEINNTTSGKFRDRDLYVTINDLSGKNLAHGANPKMQGKDLIDLKDADGKYFVRERIDLAKTKGKGWQDYKFVNPMSKQIEPKAMYFEKYEDMVINCGIYKPAK
ncbi:MAG: cache domain-containing protein [Burkholderiaceae bacterium]|nr:cache domain-containing protein [Burkholderiaceae bacterium]